MIRSGAVVRVRIEGLRAQSLAIVLANVLTICAEDLERGAMVSVTEVESESAISLYCGERVLNSASASNFPTAPPESIDFSANGMACAI